MPTDLDPAAGGITSGTDMDTSTGPSDMGGGDASLPIDRAFGTDLGGGIGGDLGDMTPSIGPRRGMASFWAGSQDAGSGSPSS